LTDSRDFQNFPNGAPAVKLTNDRPMPLTEAGIVRYALDQGLIALKEVVDGNFIASPASRRHRNLRLYLGDGAGFFVKQSGPHGPTGAASIGREAAFYWLTATVEPFRGHLRNVVPGYVLYDATRSILVLENAPGVAPHLQQSIEKGFPPEIGGAVARALAAVHRIERSAAGRDAALIVEEPPWPLLILTPEARSGLPQNPGMDFALDVIARHSGFERALGRLREGWRAQRLIHTDLKWDNCVVETRSGEAPGQTEPRVRIVDWEMVSWGDPAWDAGSLIQDYLSQGMLGSPLSPHASPEAVGAAAERVMTAIRPAIGAFWNSYAGEVSDPEFLRRSVAFAGARILQTCVEVLSMSSAMTPNVAALLQLSHAMLDHPESAAISFLGFR
jgi:hypothetical protein